VARGEAIMPVPEGQITGSEVWTTPEAVEEKCPCFYGGTCPTNGEHKDDL
jgi:hypothetical protein